MVGVKVLGVDTGAVIYGTGRHIETIRPAELEELTRVRLENVIILFCPPTPHPIKTALHGYGRLGSAPFGSMP